MGLLPRHYFIGTVLFIMCIVGTVSLIAEIEGGATTNTDVIGFSDEDTLIKFNRTFNNIDDIQDNVTSLNNQLRELRVNSLADAITLPVAMIQSSWKLITFIRDIFGVMNGAIEGLSEFLGVPAWVPQLIILIVTIYFVFSIIALVFGKDF